jgi:ABC-type bacteriocin/lantibiotic exporter with double-glycine peptidase domain
MKKSRIFNGILEMFWDFKSDFIIIIPCTLAISVLTFFQPIIIRNITDKGMVNKNIHYIFIFTGLLFLSYVILYIINLVQTKRFITLHKKISNTLFRRSFLKLYKLPLSYYYSRNSAEITNTIFTDVDTLSSVLDKTLSFSMSSIFQLVSGCLGMAIISWKISLFILVCVPIKIFLSIFFSRIKNNDMKLYLKNNNLFYEWLSDQIKGIKEIKLWNLLEIKLRGFSQVQEKLLCAYQKNRMIDQYQEFWEGILNIIITCTLYMFSGYLIIHDYLSIGDALAILAYSGYILSPLSAIINLKYQFSIVKPSVERLLDFFDLDEEGNFVIDDSEKNVNRKNDKDTPIIEFNNVSFGYSKKTKVLKKVDFKIFKGEKVAIIGENGSGKTTIANLMLGLIKPDSGKIIINGQQVGKTNMEELREKISVVNQSPYLFQETVKENINLKRESNIDKIKHVCKICGIDEFISKLPNGYNQKIGVEGAKLSGGEKQKIAVARAFLKEADLFIFDEATANLDVESNMEIYKRFNKIYEDKTAIFITHRMEELENVDRIIELKDGKIENVF